MTQPGRFSKLDFAKEGSAAAESSESWPNETEETCLRSGDELFNKGQYETALAAYSRALRFNRDLAAAWLGQVRCLICLGEYPEAITWSDRGLERFPKSPDLLAGKGLALVLRGEIAEGVEYLDGAVELRSPSSWVWLARGESLLHVKNSEANAHHCFLKAMEITPNDPSKEFRVGMAYNACRLYARAQGPLLSAARKLSTNPLALYHAGVAQRALGNESSAVGYFQRALAVEPRFSAARDALDSGSGRSTLSKFLIRLQHRWKGRR